MDQAETVFIFVLCEVLVCPKGTNFAVVVLFCLIHLILDPVALIHIFQIGRLKFMLVRLNGGFQFCLVTALDSRHLKGVLGLDIFNHGITFSTLDTIRVDCVGIGISDLISINDETLVTRKTLDSERR